MTSTIFISFFVFCMLAVGGLALYYGLYGSHRMLEERFAELAVRIKASQGGTFDDDDHDEHLGRALFRWAASRVPAPDLDTPAGEKLQQTLIQAGFIGSTSPHMFRVAQVLVMIGGAIVLGVGSLVMHKPPAMILI